MIVINAPDVVKQAAAQMTGYLWTLEDGTQIKSSEIEALDSFDIADVGRNVVDPATGELVKGTAETFFQQLISVVSRIEVNARAYEGDMNDFMVKDDEWGGFVERVYFDLAEIIEDPKWNLMANYKAGKKDYSKEELSFYPLKAHAKVFQETKPILTPISKPSDQLKEAVRNWDEMRALISGIQTAVSNTIAAALQSYRHMLAQCAIAVSMKNTKTAVDLGAEYKAATGKTVDAVNWQGDSDFMRFAAQFIAETRDNMKTFNSAFNDGTVPTFTDEGYSKLILLNKFDKALRFNVRANTYNENLLGFGPYSTTTSWQGYNSGGSNFDFDSVSKVMIGADAEDKLGIGTTAFTATGVVGLLFDRMALGICPFKRKVTGNYVSVADFYNEFHHTLINLILDTKYPIVAFYIGTQAS